MKEEIESDQVAAAAREGFGPQLADKKAARGLAKDLGAAPSVTESVLGRCRAEANGSGGEGTNGESPEGGGPDEARGEALRRARALLSGKIVEPGEARTREAELQAEGGGRLIDRLRVVPDAQSGAYTAHFNRLSVKATIPEELAQAHPRAFRDGFYAEIELGYDADTGGRPFEVTGLRPLQESTGELLESLAAGREAFTAGEWAYFLVQSVGLDPFADGFRARRPGADGLEDGASGGGQSDLSKRDSSEKDSSERDQRGRQARALGLALLRLVPLAERRFNLLELGPRQTGKSYLYEKFAPRTRLLSGGKASVSKLFLDTRSGEEGLVADQDVVAFDEISSTDFQGEEVVSALKTYMESGQVSRGKSQVQGRASIVMLGNIDEPPRQLLRREPSEERDSDERSSEEKSLEERTLEERSSEGHLFVPFPKRLQGDTALMDRIGAYLPGWEVPKISPDSLAEGLGLTASYLAECLSRLRGRSLGSRIETRVALRGNLTKRDRDAVLQAASGLLKLIYPGLVVSSADRTIENVPRPVLRWTLWLGAESRLRVRQQQCRIQPGEFPDGDFRFQIDPDSGETVEERVFLPEEQPR